MTLSERLAAARRAEQKYKAAPPDTPPVRSGAEFVGRVLFFFVGATLHLALGLLGVFVLADYWRWFLTPTFGLPAPPLLMLYGLMVMARLAAGSFKVGRYKPSPDEEARKYPGWQRVGSTALALLVLWGLGWLIQATYRVYPF